MFPFQNKLTDKSSEKNPKKKKQAIKNWGKWERFFVFFILFITSLASALLAVWAREWKLPGLPRISLPTSLFEETFVLTGERQSNPYDKIKNQFEALTKDLSGVYGFYVYRLGSDESYGMWENELFPAASLIKLPVMIAFYQELEQGKVNPDGQYKLKETDKIAGAGSLQLKSEGTLISYREMIELMGKQSDNSAFGIIKRLLGEDQIQELIDYLGMKNTSLANNQTTPADIGTLFFALWQGEVVSQQSRDQILDYLTDTIYEDWIPKGIPENIRVAHKFGREVHVINDAGIVFTNQPYVVVILSKGIVESEADELIPEFSKVIYQFESR
jgi:beta-lactamase class A